MYQLVQGGQIRIGMNVKCATPIDLGDLSGDRRLTYCSLRAVAVHPQRRILRHDSLKCLGEAVSPIAMVELVLSAAIPSQLCRVSNPYRSQLLCAVERFPASTILYSSVEAPE
jgi:hypothetical protein